MARKQDKQTTALKQLEAEANKAAARYSAAVVEEEKAREAYRRAHAEVLQHREYLARTAAERAAPRTDYELQAAAAFERG